jgi:peptidoglycan hydrolase-like protein with peptidoglycan-binding domain
MFDQLELEAEPFEFEDTETGTGSADQEWEGEFGRGRRIPFRPSRFGRTPPAPRRLPGRPSRPAGGVRLPRPMAYRPRFDRLAAVVYPPRDGAPGPAASEYVRWVQSALNQVLSRRLPVNGIPGEETRDAIRAFQQQQGLPADGIVGPDTERALIAARGGGRPDTSTELGELDQAAFGAPAEFEGRESSDGVFGTTAPGSQRTGVAAELEAFDGELSELEWEDEVNRSSRDYIRWVQQSLNQILGQRLAVDGVSGPLTRDAIRTFQQRKGLTVDGIVGPITEAAIYDALKRSPTAATPAPPTSVRPDAVILGLDTASVADNKNPSWAQAKAEGGIRFAIIRSNWGVSTDGVFRRDWPKMQQAGIVRGAYLFLRFPHPKYNMRAPDPAAQAEALIRTVGSLDPSDLPPTLDVEFPGGRRVTGMTAQQILDGVRAAWRVLKGYYGVAPIIYTSGRVWHEDLNDIAAPDLVDSPLWLARYPFRKGPAVHDARVARLNPPPVPQPWGDATNWWIHQYQGDALRFPGFPTGNVDLNRFNPMRSGATGDRVKWVQRRLGIAQNGQFDGAMERALRAFQSQKGLPVDGVIDPRTFAYLCWSRP